MNICQQSCNARWAIAVTTLALAGCGGAARLTVDEGTGPHPMLPSPTKSLLPTVNVAPAKGWTDGAAPTPAPGLVVTAYAKALDHPRWLCVLPNGDVLVAETNAPPKPDDGKGIRAWVAKLLMKKAGADTPSANRITLLRDADGDGIAETRSVLLEGLNSPFGMALVGSDLYVAATDALLRFPYVEGQTQIGAAATKVADLPAGTINHHWTKNVIAAPDGAKLYVSVGSNSNVGENGMAVEEGRAAIWEIDVATGAKRLFATGLRNPNGMGWEPSSGALWTVVNERDEIGDDASPDYLTSVRPGGFYGWPWSYWGQHADARAWPRRPDMIAKAIKPDYALAAHTASLGLTFADGAKLGPAFAEGAFVGQHGSWNRSVPSGYRVLFVPFANGKPSGPPREVLGGFLAGKQVHGRPVGVAIDHAGALLVADDTGNTIWRVTAAAPAPPA